MPVSKRYGLRVKINFRGSFPDGRIIDDHLDDEPYEVLLGAGMLPIGVEAALLEMEIGEERLLMLSPDQAFGEIDSEGIIKVPRYAVPRAHELEKGMTIEWSSQKAPKNVLVRIVDIDECTVTMDYNHPLAGESLVYQLKLVDIVD